MSSAIEDENIDILKILIDNKADLNLIDSSNASQLNRAISKGNQDIVSLYVA